MSKVSILIPCFNSDQWIGEAIQSALAQTWPECEVIVVDDGSTDRSLEVIRSFDGQVRWESGPNRGGNVTRNRLLDLAQGDWLQYLDADDYLEPRKVAQQMEFLAEHPRTDVVYGPVTIEHWNEGESQREICLIPEPHDPWILLARWYLPQTGAPLWRKRAIEEVGGWKPDQPCCQEHELYMRLLLAGKRFEYCPAGGAVYRQWGEHTVCKRDKPEVHRRRLAIEQALEDHLRESEQLTAARLRAISQARFETARSVWQYDPKIAVSIMTNLSKSDPGFKLGGNAAPIAYRAMYRLFGFRGAECLAETRRKWLK